MRVGAHGGGWSLEERMGNRRERKRVFEWSNLRERIEKKNEKMEKDTQMIILKGKIGKIYDDINLYQ